jgi:hypothetical protein
MNYLRFVIILDLMLIVVITRHLHIIQILTNGLNLMIQALIKLIMYL